MESPLFVNMNRKVSLLTNRLILRWEPSRLDFNLRVRKVD